MVWLGCSAWSWLGPGRRIQGRVWDVEGSDEARRQKAVSRSHPGAFAKCAHRSPFLTWDVREAGLFA